jgi:transcriptional regulator with XRE-family HTH domain
MRVMDAGHPARGPADEMRSSLAGPTVVRMLLGGRLRQLREASGMTRADAGWAIRGSDAKISRLETGRSSFKRRDVADLLTLYGVRDHRERDGLFVLVDQANAPGWRQEYGDLLSGSAGTRLELEQCASVIRCYQAQFVPDLLQTTDYARALLGLHHPGAQPSEIERRIELLMKRQEALRGPQPCRLWAVVDEAALRRRPGNATALRMQLERLIEISELPHVKIQVIPFTTCVAVGGAVTFLRFAESGVADVVYLDQFTGALYLDKPADVQHYGQVMDKLSTRAERPAVTPPFLHRLSKEI